MAKLDPKTGLWWANGLSYGSQAEAEDAEQLYYQDTSGGLLTGGITGQNDSTYDPAAARTARAAAIEDRWGKHKDLITTINPSTGTPNANTNPGGAAGAARIMRESVVGNEWTGDSPAQ